MLLKIPDDNEDDFEVFLENVRNNAVQPAVEWDAEAAVRNFDLSGVLFGPDGSREFFLDSDDEEDN